MMCKITRRLEQEEQYLQAIAKAERALAMIHVMTDGASVKRQQEASHQITQIEAHLQATKKRLKQKNSPI